MRAQTEIESLRLHSTEVRTFVTCLWCAHAASGGPHPPENVVSPRGLPPKHSWLTSHPGIVAPVVPRPQLWSAGTPATKSATNTHSL